jgi:transcriptional regulator with XRE-family HTH domain
LCFGKRLRQIRLEKGFSQEDLAYSSGLTLSQIGRIERGVINTSLSTIFVIARTLNVELPYLFDISLPAFEFQN